MAFWILAALSEGFLGGLVDGIVAILQAIFGGLGGAETAAMLCLLAVRWNTDGSQTHYFAKEPDATNNCETFVMRRAA